MSSNNNFKETFLTKKGEDVTFGEDSTDLMVVNSNAEFTGSLTVNGESVSGGSGGGGAGGPGAGGNPGGDGGTGIVFVSYTPA